MNILVTGAGGFIGGHLVKNLIKNKKNKIIAVDIKPLKKWFQKFDCENIQLNLIDFKNCKKITKNINVVYNLACNMGGIQFIHENEFDCLLNVYINTNLIKASIQNKVSKYFYASSACVYNINLQKNNKNISLKEEDVFPAYPESGYGWEKLFSEQVCLAAKKFHNLDVKIARFHNVYGPFASWNDGKEKAPLAICRKIAIAKIKDLNEIEIIGDGNQTRSFMFIDDCIKGINLIMNSKKILEPINLGSSCKITINELVDVVSNIAGVKLKKKYIKNIYSGVYSRNSNNQKIKKFLNWEPDTELFFGLKKTYEWIENKLINSNSIHFNKV